MSVRKLHLDFETRSTVDLKVHGAYRYAKHPDTSVNCMAWRVDKGPVKVWARGEPFPPELLREIHQGIRFHAWNAQFERLIWQHCQCVQLGWPEVPFDLWRCTAAKSAHANHPRKLSSAAKVLLPAGLHKDMGGAAIMQSMAKPVRKTKRNAHIEGLIWVDDVFSQAITEAYCHQDVMVESALDDILPDWPEEEVKIWQRNERINDRGVPFDRELCNSADYVLNQTMEEISQRISKATDGLITTGNQIQRIKTYIQERGVNAVCLDKHHLAALLETELSEEVRDVLLLRQVTSGSAAKKYRAALDCMEEDDRGYGLFLYYAASTGRFASMRVQIQNMKHGADTTSRFRDVVGTYDMDQVKEAYNGTIITTLGDNVRSIVCAPEGSTFVRCDSSQIEARVLSWLAGNDKMLRLFRDKVDPYIDLAQKIFNKTISKGDSERQVGKAAVLGLGFGMGSKRFVAQIWEKEKIKLTEKFAQRIVNVYRNDNPSIPKFWANLEKAARACVKDGMAVRVGLLTLRVEAEYLTITLPSGRKLFFYRPRFTGSGRDVRFEYTSPRGVRNEWAGGLLCENVVQAVARDTLAHYMILAQDRGLDIVAHIHDELMLQCPTDQADDVEKQIMEVFATPLPWMKGLPCAAEAKVHNRYAG